VGIPYEVRAPLSCEQVRRLDVLAMEHYGIPGLLLMENAGRGIAEFVYACLVNPSAARVLVLCGAGNNGGDGFVVARHLHNAGVAVRLALAVTPERMRGDAEVNLRIAERMEIPRLLAFEAAGLAAVRVEAEQADVIVDGLLGTGSKGAPRGVLGELIVLANGATRARRVAIDLPSGLDGDTGAPAEPCFRADATVTMLVGKTGLYAPAAREYVGRVVVVDIGVPRAALARGGNISAGG
jgi:NAD(P)H-hydrate epimerase